MYLHVAVAIVNRARSQGDIFVDLTVRVSLKEKSANTNGAHILLEKQNQVWIEVLAVMKT